MNLPDDMRTVISFDDWCARARVVVDSLRFEVVKVVTTPQLAPFSENAYKRNGWSPRDKITWKIRVLDGDVDVTEAFAPNHFGTFRTRNEAAYQADDAREAMLADLLVRSSWYDARYLPDEVLARMLPELQ